MKYNFRTIASSCFAVLLLAGFASCKKTEGGELGALPKADFVAIPSATNPNDITLVNKSNSATIPYWRIGNSSTLKIGDSAKVNFGVKGTYNVTLFADGQGGIDSVTKAIVIAQDDPTACLTNQKGHLAGCSSKKWKLNPVAGAYKVGDGGPDVGNWWTSPAGEPAARPCEFNDEYTFNYTTGAFIYDNKGDFYGDGYLGNNTGTCQPTSNYTPAQAPWGSGTFTFEFTEGAGVRGLGQFKVIGLGAHIGLQKVRNGGEVQTPATSITYDILSYTAAPGGDIMTVGVNIGGNGWWAFQLKSF
ncbi:MAG: hypothetical protein JWQ27_226 [Ferruginibacter sp.]|nr:hypothetical protein [Ferruginibacter sp.]